MSAETREWLANNVLVGFTEKRGTAWHYKAGDTNHYEGAIPVEDVIGRLFSWDAVQVPLTYKHDGQEMGVDGRVGIVRSDTGALFSVTSAKYGIVQYKEWCLDLAEMLLDSELSIESAGLVKGGGIGWVSIGVPENITTPSGVEFRPSLLATTSHNTEIPNIYKRVNTLVVCDNTHRAALSERGEEVRVRHTKNVRLQMEQVRQDLNLIYEDAADFVAEIERLNSQVVTDRQFEQIVQKVYPATGDSKRSETMLKATWDSITDTYRSHPYCAPWKGTGFGVLQTFNTWRQHIRPVRKSGANVVERTMLETLNGVTDAKDGQVLEVLASVVG